VFPTADQRGAAERSADCIVHLGGIAATLPALAWLLHRAIASQATALTASLAIYAIGLGGMLGVSLLYNAAAPGRTKMILRRLDHTMIFVMIAGTYTPFAIWALAPRVGLPLLAAVWSVASIGIAFKLARPVGHDRLFLALYLAMGWMVLVVMRPLIAVLPGAAFALLILGGAVYSLGALLQAGRPFRFQNAIWHGMVVAAALLHMGAVACLVPGRVAVFP
jgi:hemolysin III